MTSTTRKESPVGTTGTALETDTVSPFKRFVGAVGVQNISLIIAIALVVAVIGIQNPLFFTVPNLKVIGTAIAIVGLLAVVRLCSMRAVGLSPR